MEQTARALAVLKERAHALKKMLSEKQGGNPYPFLFEFAGTPKSGKSTCIDIISHFFRRTGFGVHAPTEGASKRTPYFLKPDVVAYNAWCASYALSHILESVYGPDKFELAILDRGLFDSLAWFELATIQGRLTEEDRDAIASFLMVAQWRKHINCVFMFHCDHTTALQREYEHKLIDEPGLAMNADFLTKLNTAYESVRERYSISMPVLHVIDTSGSKSTTPISTASQIATHIMDCMEGKWYDDNR